MDQLHKTDAHLPWELGWGLYLSHQIICEHDVDQSIVSSRTVEELLIRESGSIPPPYPCVNFLSNFELKINSISTPLSDIVYNQFCFPSLILVSHWMSRMPVTLSYLYILCTSSKKLSFVDYTEYNSMCYRFLMYLCPYLHLSTSVLQTANIHF